jgi:hypothetical protein
MPDDRDAKDAEPEVARILMPERQEVELREFHLDGAVPADHRVRAVWAFVEGLDLAFLDPGDQRP